MLLAGRTLGSGTKEGFTSKERDAESGLDYFGARYYMSALGRWTTVDPPADSFPEWSPYNYVEGNPVSYSDPFGLCPVGRNPDYNVEDCPDNDIGASLRLLRSEGGDLGDMLIRHIADNRLKIRTSSRGRSKLRGDVITLQQRDNLGGMVGDLTHEVTHHILNVGLHPTAQEMVSWSVGLTVYEGLPSQYQQDAEYDRQSYIRSQNPLGWLGNVCRAAVRAYGGGSQFCF